MEPTDVAIRILQTIQETLVGLRDDTNARFGEVNGTLGNVHATLAQHGERLEALQRHGLRMERHAEATKEILGLMNSRLGLFERAATAAAEGRARLEDRMDRIEARMDALERDT